MHVIKVPAVYTLKLPGGEWLNLALRRLQIELAPPTVLITWENGDSHIYRDIKAVAIINAWSEIECIDKSTIEAIA